MEQGCSEDISNFSREKKPVIFPKRVTPKKVFSKICNFREFREKFRENKPSVCTWRLSPVLTDAPPLSSSCSPDSCNIKKDLLRLDYCTEMVQMIKGR
jgi:hypothetical protein